jgi:predicted O-linked N-acetylglucosamine transferase (SPINDLY family)
LTDPFLDPPGMELAYSEKTLWLPHCFWCYEPIVPTPEVNDLPAAKAGYLTFGCLNNFAKVTLPTRHLWARVLQAVPQSHMQILAPVCAERQKILDLFAGYGIESQRVEFINRLPHDAYFRQLQQIDIGLDPIPYPGHTTTLDALWMGVPVVSLAGSTAVSRGGSTMLNNVGLSELVTHSPDQYLATATALANDLARLADLRKGLRQRMEQSPLTNGKQFAHDLETLYRQMWHTWCKTVCVTH